MDHLDPQRLLEGAVDAFDAIVAERGWDQPALLLRIEGGLDADEGADLGWRALDGHPSATLLGFEAPSRWSALGLSAEGRGTAYGDGPGGRPARVRTTLVIDRQGSAAGRLRWEDGRRLDEPPTDGLLVDCLRRALGLATPPPAGTTATLFATLWLESVAAASRQCAQAITWRRAAALHPAAQLLARDGQPVPEDLVAIAGALARACGWSEVRRQVTRGWLASEIDASLAAWMDTGMLSRWLLDWRPPVAHLVTSLAEVLPPSVLRRVRRTLRALRLELDDVAASPTQPDVA